MTLIERRKSHGNREFQSTYPRSQQFTKLRKIAISNRLRDINNSFVQQDKVLRLEKERSQIENRRRITVNQIETAEYSRSNIAETIHDSLPSHTSIPEIQKLGEMNQALINRVAELESLQRNYKEKSSIAQGDFLDKSKPSFDCRNYCTADRDHLSPSDSITWEGINTHRRMVSFGDNSMILGDLKNISQFFFEEIRKQIDFIQQA